MCTIHVKKQQVFWDAEVVILFCLCYDFTDSVVWNVNGEVKMIETKRLIFREYTSADYDDLAAVISDPETMKHYPRPYDANGVNRWLNWNFDNYREYGFGLWALVLKETGEFIGDCGITMQNIDGEQLPEIGYHINKKYWLQGLACEAARAVRDWTFENTEFKALYSYMTQGNTASWSTAASAGMKRIKEYTDDYYGEMCVYAITRQEWEEIKE